MSEIGSPGALAPTDALRSLITAARAIPSSTRDRGDEALIDGFLGDWVVMGQVDHQMQLMSMREWQKDAKLAFAVLITAMSNVNAQYPALNLGPRVLEEAERLIREKGMDPDEVLQRFVP